MSQTTEIPFSVPLGPSQATPNDVLFPAEIWLHLMADLVEACGDFKTAWALCVASKYLRKIIEPFFIETLRKRVEWRLYIKAYMRRELPPIVVPCTPNQICQLAVSTSFSPRNYVANSSLSIITQTFLTFDVPHDLRTLHFPQKTNIYFFVEYRDPTQTDWKPVGFLMAPDIGATEETDYWNLNGVFGFKWITDEQSMGITDEESVGFSFTRETVFDVVKCVNEVKVMPWRVVDRVEVEGSHGTNDDGNDD